MADEDDATMAALEQYAEDGSDLSQPMAIDFFVAIPTEEAGEAVSRRARQLGFLTSVEQSEKTGEWTCYCQKTIIPSFASVRFIERQLDEIARESGGRADGFGSFGNAPAPN